MTEALPEDMPEELEPAVLFDSARLIADVRKGDPSALAEAYRRTFGTALGRLVLLHALAEIGLVGASRGPETLEQANHNNGRGFAVLEIAGRAGFDPVAISAAGLTQTLEGAAHEHRIYGHQRHDGQPDVVFDDFGSDGAGGGFDGGADGDDIDLGSAGPGGG